MEDEFTAKIHSEFSVSRETDLKHRAGCVWGVVGFNADKADIERWAKEYGVSYAECVKWKSYWRTLHENSKKR